MKLISLITSVAGKNYNIAYQGATEPAHRV